MPGAEKIGEFGVWYVVFLFTLTFHEGSHALVAWLLGDDTAYRGGQVSLNPWPHLRREPFGTIVIPILSFVVSGWMMGWASAPYDPWWGQRHPRRLAAMSAAGPAANLLLALVVFLLLKALLGAGFFVPPQQASFGHLVAAPAATPEASFAHALAFGMSVALNLNVLLCLFNLIPLPPLDGAGILGGLLPGSVGAFLESFSRSPMMAMVGLLVAWRVFDFIYPAAFSVVLSLLHPEVAYR